MSARQDRTRWLALRAWRELARMFTPRMGEARERTGKSEARTVLMRRDA